MAGIITLIFVFTTIYSLLGGYPQRVEFLVIPVATLFTVTQLRATMPGAPNGFGNSCFIIKPFKRKENLMSITFQAPLLVGTVTTILLLLKFEILRLCCFASMPCSDVALRMLCLGYCLLVR
jgi:hypothetical protein